jgi:hypothetical protein
MRKQWRRAALRFWFKVRRSRALSDPIETDRGSNSLFDRNFFRSTGVHPRLRVAMLDRKLP